MASLATVVPGNRTRELSIAAFAIVAVPMLYAVGLSWYGDSPYAIASLPAIAVGLLLIVSVEVSIVAVVAALFLPLSASWFSAAVWATIPLAFAVAWRLRDARSVDVATPLSRGVIVYGLCILPSLIIPPVPLASFTKLFNVAAFLIVVYGAAAWARRPSDIKRIALLYLSFAVLNGLHVILQSQIFQMRTFGFAGIMFVDLGGLGVVISMAAAASTRGRSRVLFLIIATLLGVALVYTQTRSIWLAVAVSLFILFVYLVRFPSVVGLTRGSFVRMSMLGGLLLVGSASAPLYLLPAVASRAAELLPSDANEPALTETGRVSSSLVSRALIWGTAMNAFLARPVTGIGVYAFPFVSQQYSSLPPWLYRKFVRYLTPHQSIIAVASETGVIGLFGFLFFMTVAVRHAFAAVRSAIDEEHRRIAFVSASALTYICISMLVTDAWLWGQLIVLFGLVLGVVCANARMSPAVPRALSTGRL